MKACTSYRNDFVKLFVHSSLLKEEVVNLHHYEYVRILSGWRFL